MSSQVIEFYKDFDVSILRACKKSPFTLRAPHAVARFYTSPDASNTDEHGVEVLTQDTAYASSYFSYSRFSHIYKFYESSEFLNLEKRFTFMSHLDIANFFPSLYTHSISWALRGKARAKKDLEPPRPESAFDKRFDALMQAMNYRETHGILVGPELCRLFSEIILQKIDVVVKKRLAKRKIDLGRHYWCYRFIDDYFVFYNDEHTRMLFIEYLTEELSKYRLELSVKKARTMCRPFVTPLSTRKIQISELLSQLASQVPNLKASESLKVLNRFRLLVRESEGEFAGLSNFTLSSIKRQISSAFRIGGTGCFDLVYVMLELAFHTLSMDIRVAPAYKICEIILATRKGPKKLLAHEASILTDKIAFEMQWATESAILQSSPVECMNLVIASSEYSKESPLSTTFAQRLVESIREQHDDEYSSIQRLTYFEIVSLLYYCGGNITYSGIKDLVLGDALSAMRQHDPREYAETAYLLLDLVCCPHLTVDEKNKVIEAAMVHERPRSSVEVNRFRNYVAKQNWFFDWESQEKLAVNLQKKRFKLSYEA